MLCDAAVCHRFDSKRSKVKLELARLLFQITNLVTRWHRRCRRFGRRLLPHNLLDIVRLNEIVNKVSRLPILKLVLGHAGLRQKRPQRFILSR